MAAENSPPHPCPSVHAGDLRELRAAARHWKEDPDSTQPPPWTLVRLPDSDETHQPGQVRLAAVDVDYRGEPWLIRGVLLAGPEGLVLSQVVVEHLFDEEKEVTGRVLHALKFGEIRRRAVALVKSRDEVVIPILREVFGDVAYSEREVEGWREAAAGASRKRGRKGRLGEDYYRDLALEYLKLTKRRNFWDPPVLETLERRHGVPEETIRTRLKVAKKHGFLTGEKGRHYQAGPNLYEHEKEDDDG